MLNLESGEAEGLLAAADGAALSGQWHQTRSLVPICCSPRGSPRLALGTEQLLLSPGRAAPTSGGADTKNPSRGNPSSDFPPLGVSSGVNLGIFPLGEDLGLGCPQEGTGGNGWDCPKPLLLPVGTSFR